MSEKGKDVFFLFLNFFYDEREKHEKDSDYHTEFKWVFNFHSRSEYQNTEIANYMNFLQMMDSMIYSILEILGITLKKVK